MENMNGGRVSMIDRRTSDKIFCTSYNGNFGCIITDAHGYLLATSKKESRPSFNSFPVAHPAVSALIASRKNGDIYCITLENEPCSDCAAAIVASGCKKVVINKPGTSVSIVIMQCFGINVKVMNAWEVAHADTK